jgi:hypothetical protein
MLKTMLKTMGLLHAVGQWTLMFLFHVIFLCFLLVFWRLPETLGTQAASASSIRSWVPEKGPVLPVKLPTEGTKHPAKQAMT